MTLARIDRKERFPHIDLSDYRSWQDGLDALHSAGGGRAIAPAGTHEEPLTIYDGVYLEGLGQQATTLRLPSGSPAGTHVVQTDDYAALRAAGTETAPANFGVSRLTIDGNKAGNPSGGSCLAIYGRHYETTHLNLINAAADGLTSAWATGTGYLVDGESMESELHAIHITNCDGHGFNFDGPHDSQISKVNPYKNGLNGFHITANAVGSQFVSCHSWGWPQDWAWWIEAGMVQLVGCFGESSLIGQLMIAANSVSVTGGRYFQTVGAAVKGIQIGNGTNVTGLNILTDVYHCESGAIVFANDGGGSRVDVGIYQTAGAVVTGATWSRTDTGRAA